MKRTFVGGYISRCFTMTKNLAEVEWNSKVMVNEGGVLLRVQHLRNILLDPWERNLWIYFKKGCTRVPMDSRCHLIHLNRQKKVVIKKDSPRQEETPGYLLQLPSLLESADQACCNMVSNVSAQLSQWKWQPSNICSSVATYVRLVRHTSCIQKGILAFDPNKSFTHQVISYGTLSPRCERSTLQCLSSQLQAVQQNREWVRSVEDWAFSLPRTPTPASSQSQERSGRSRGPCVPAGCRFSPRLTAVENYERSTIDKDLVPGQFCN